MAATTLYEYYKTLGQPLPGLKERSKTFQDLGLGQAEGYKGTYEQNVSLLNRLQSMKPTPPVAPTTTTAPQTQSLAPSSGSLAGSTPPTPPATVQDRYQQMLQDLFSKLPSSIIPQADIYQQELTAQNVDPQKQNLQSLDQRIADMKANIDASEQDIRNRITQSGGIVTEDQAQRLVASEKEPLLREYNRLIDQRNIASGQLTAAQTQAQQTAQLKYQSETQPLENLKTMLGLGSDISKLSPSATKIIGSGTSGYTVVNYNPLTGQVLNTQPLTGSSAGGGMSGESIDSLAKGVIAGRIAPSQLPGFGVNSLRSQVLNKVFQTNPNFDAATAESNFTAKQTYTRYINSPTYQNVVKYLDALTGAGGQKGNLDELVRLSDSISRTDFPAVNSAEFAALMQSGDPNVAAYAAAVTEVADQVAKILQGGGTGSGTSDAKLEQAQQILSGKFSKSQIKSIAAELKTLLGNRGRALKSNTMQTIQDQVNQERSSSEAAGSAGEAAAEEPTQEINLSDLNFQF